MSVWRRNVLIISAAIILGIVAGSCLFASQYLLAGDTFPPGTFVAKQDLSGLGRGKAVSLISNQTNGFAAVEYVFTASQMTYSIKAEDLGAKLQVASFVNQIMEQEGSRGLWDRIRHHQRRDYPLKIPIEYDREKYNQFMAHIMESMEDPVRISRVKWDENGNPILVPGQSGFRLDPEATFTSLPQYYTGEKKITAQLVVDYESVSVDPAGINNLVELGTYSTYFNTGNLNRSSNLRIAASTLNGAVVPPGQEFSFNTAVGPREFSTGYKEALIILQNEFKPGIGGGVCQVSSTLYNAALLTNLPILERHNHSVAVDYVPVGTDATVTYQGKDLRFKNDTGGPIIIKTTVQGGRLTVQLIGRRSGPAVNVKIEREVIGVTDFKEIRRDDPELMLGQEKVDHEGTKGYRVRTYRTVYDEKGQMVKRELLSSDVYKPLDKLILVGTKLPAYPGQDPPDQDIPDPALPGDPASEPGEPAAEDPANDPAEPQPGDPGEPVDPEEPAASPDEPDSLHPGPEPNPPTGENSDESDQTNPGGQI